MAGKFRFELVSPEQVLFSGEATQVVVPGAEGDFAVLAGHAPFISTLRPGVLEITLEGGNRRVLVKGGFAEAEPDRLTVLAETAYDVANLSPQRISEELATAEAELGSATNDETRRFATALIDQLHRLQGKAA
jgi:F-type H+-transporting ATPase subunit epsilon